eukprot:CAMPEP_0115484290 /NCGR_PEP_ID=MMETSP0271-20121206/59303_1 /TAXON_ID=71861 /ORGANISM="Scrippsiella trochoidea, Strain CCMP3099" /LENGTH=92 /DNA_ID=CAMNT_0002912183 /DNA_START=229 /DNA_END=505 /DNA_ORIENTATION=+
MAELVQGEELARAAMSRMKGGANNKGPWKSAESTVMLSLTSDSTPRSSEASGDAVSSKGVCSRAFSLASSCGARDACTSWLCRPSSISAQSA